MILSHEFLARLNHDAGSPHKVLHPNSKGILEAHDWPGNIRELENLIRREFILEEGTVINICDPTCEACLPHPEMNAALDPNNQSKLSRDAGHSGCSDRRHQDRRLAAYKHLSEAGNATLQFTSKTTNTGQLLTYAEFKKNKETLIAQLEMEHLIALLTRTSGNLSLASRLSGRDRSDLCKLLKRHGLDRQSFLSKLPDTTHYTEATQDLPVFSEQDQENT